MLRAKPIRIGIVAGEISGDLLGAGLIRALKARLGDVQFEGIAGPRMQAEGCRSLFPMDRLSLIGFEGVKKIWSILAIRRQLAAHFVADPPELFIGVDVPDFNLGLEQKLKSAGIPTVHYVSPTVWAWRGYRVRKIHKAVDHMLALFPFEAKYYEAHHVPVTFVGHPLADQIELRPDRAAARRKLDLPPDRVVVALMPGSRSSELRRHASLFVATALWLWRRNPNLCFVAPFANRETRDLFMAALMRGGGGRLPIVSLLHHSREALAACDIVVLASGTATLEAALYKRLMVVTYKVSWLSAVLIRLFSHVKLYSLPNNLAGREVVPEFLQSNAVPEKLGAAVEYYLSHPEAAEALVATLSEIHVSLRQNANERAAEAVIQMLKRCPRLPQAAVTVA